MTKNRFKLRLISQNTQDSDAISGKRFSQMTIPKHAKRVIFLLPLMFVLTPVVANAGFFSFGVLFGENSKNTDSAQVAEVTLNSQNVQLLQTATNLNPDPAVGGADITIAENKALISETGVGGSFVEISEKQGDTISIYEVKNGDTLSQIADMFNVSINTIRWANNFSGDIQPGQKLVILPIDGLKHIVKSGGTVADIAKIYGADSREIALFNDIPEDKELKAGDEIIVPHAEKLEPKSETKSKSKGKTIAIQSNPSGTKSNWMTHPVPNATKTQGIHGYNAIDLGAKTGSPIYAAAGGTVILSKSEGWNGGYAKYIVIQHSNGVQTLYAHNSQNLVTVGQQVSQGELIGYVGSTGNSTGPHVHFEVRGAKNPF